MPLNSCFNSAVAITAYDSCGKHCRLNCITKQFCVDTWLRPQDTFSTKRLPWYRKLDSRSAFISNTIAFIAFKVPGDCAGVKESVLHIRHIWASVYFFAGHAKQIIPSLQGNVYMLHTAESIYSVWA